MATIIVGAAWSAVDVPYAVLEFRSQRFFLIDLASSIGVLQSVLSNL
jgi:hypothetical protein